ncbi:MAG: MFS transporter [Caulobacterales bacterium]|nr:MFS transporter [Caulobacterales bacterium]
MGSDANKVWTHITIVFVAGSLATALVPLTVPIIGTISQEFGVDRSSLGWVVSFPTLVCALGALACGFLVDRVGDVRLLLTGVVLVILGDLGVSFAQDLNWLYAARFFQGFGYVCLSVAGPAFIQRTTTGDRRRAAMAFWAAHTPLGFAVAVYFGAQLIAADMSWRFSFIGHAAVALVIGLTLFALNSARSEADLKRSAGALKVLTSVRPYAVAIGAGATGMLQVGVMVLLPHLLQEGRGFTGPEWALVIVAAMAVNWIGAMAIVTTKLRNAPAVALPISAACAAALSFVIVSEVTADLTLALACVMAFTLTIGAANALVWSLIQAAAPSTDAAGATAGLITQGSFLGVLISPPTFFWLEHEGNPALMAALAVVLLVLMCVPLIALPRAGAPVPAH